MIQLSSALVPDNWNVSDFGTIVFEHAEKVWFSKNYETMQEFLCASTKNGVVREPINVNDGPQGAADRLLARMRA